MGLIVEVLCIGPILNLCIGPILNLHIGPILNLRIVLIQFFSDFICLLGLQKL